MGFPPELLLLASCRASGSKALLIPFPVPMIPSLAGKLTSDPLSRSDLPPLLHIPALSMPHLFHLPLLSQGLLEPACKIKPMPWARLLESPEGDKPLLQVCCPQASWATWARWLHCPGPQFLHLENGEMMAARHSGVFHG